MKICGTLVDIHKRSIYKATVTIKNHRIESIEPNDYATAGYIIPGLIDSHIHIESSMLTPGSFAVASVPHGTIGVVSDPHEIANVLGIKGIDFMINDSRKTPMKFWFGAPSCVPATDFETNGGNINIEDVEKLLDRENIKYLAEMMNFPGAIQGNYDVIKKIEAARKRNKKIDGHAPGLTGNDLRKYVEKGISTDHECSTLDEAKEKISLGMKILIREGSAARNLDALKDLYRTNPDQLMLCSDDLHPEMLENRHINKLIARLIYEGYDPFNVIRSATINPVEHYGLEVGLLRPGDKADFIIVDRLDTMNVLENWIDGDKVFSRGEISFNYKPGKYVNYFNCSPVTEDSIAVNNEYRRFRVIQAFDGELLTKENIHDPLTGKLLKPSPEEDVLKIVVKDRYNDRPPAIGYITGFGLKGGAFASSVAHDSHNIIAVGKSDRDLAIAINEVVRLNGALAVSFEGETKSLQLNIAGIMSAKSCREVSASYRLLSEQVINMGCKLSAPFMTLSFMALLVIPEIKISDRGLFDGRRFCHTPLFIE